MTRRRHWRLACVFGVVHALPHAGEARSLRDRLRSLADVSGATIALDGTGTTVRIPATLRFDYISPVVSRTALLAVDRPVVAAAPDVVYVFDPHADAFRRERVLAPVFADRATTVGRGHVEIGATLDWSDLDRVDGGSFGDAVGITRTGLAGAQSILLQRVHVDDFRLSTLAMTTHVTVGITDRLDLTLLAPVVWTHLNAGIRQQFDLFDASATHIGRSAAEPRRTRGDATGIGDLVVRAKFLMWAGDRLRVMSNLAVRTPTGDADDFHGLGDTVVTPGLASSLRFGRAEVNAGVGLDLDADDLERSRVRYVLGGTLAVQSWLSLVLELVGSSGLEDDRFEVPGVLRTVNGVEIQGVDPLASRTTLAVPRTDVVDLAVAAKIGLGDAGSLFLGTLVPLTSDGLRSAATPIIGIDVAF